MDVSKQVLELLYRQACVFDDSAKRKGAHRIAPRDGQDPRSIRHDDVSTLAYNAKSCCLKGADCITVFDAGDFGHLYAATSSFRTSAFPA